MSRLPGTIPSLLFVELVPLLVGHPGDTQADQHGRSDQNQDSTLKRGNHARAGARRLGIAERAILRVSKRRSGQRQKQRGPACGNSCRLVHPTPHFLLAPGVSLPCAARSIPRVKWGKRRHFSPASPRRLLSARTAACAAGGCCPTRSYSTSAVRRSWPESAKETSCASHA